MAMLTPFSASKCATGLPHTFFFVTYRFSTPRTSIRGLPSVSSAPELLVAGEGIAANSSCV